MTPDPFDPYGAFREIDKRIAQEERESLQRIEADLAAKYERSKSDPNIFFSRRDVNAWQGARRELGLPPVAAEPNRFMRWKFPPISMQAGLDRAGLELVELEMHERYEASKTDDSVSFTEEDMARWQDIRANLLALDVFVDQQAQDDAELVQRTIQEILLWMDKAFDRDPDMPYYNYRGVANDAIRSALQSSPPVTDATELFSIARRAAMNAAILSGDPDATFRLGKVFHEAMEHDGGRTLPFIRAHGHHSDTKREWTARIGLVLFNSECEYCGARSRTDSRGTCTACGAPKDL